MKPWDYVVNKKCKLLVGALMRELKSWPYTEKEIKL